MSEPLSSHEIEDVLSSIRRLVSEDLRPGQRGAAAAPAVAPVADKLLLTPSLRVVADATVAAEAPVVQMPAAPAPDVYDDAGMEDGSSAMVALPDAGAFETSETPVADAAQDAFDQGPGGDAGFGMDTGLEAEDDLVWAAPGAPVAAAPEDDPELPPAAAPVRGHWTAETVPVPDMDWMQAEADWSEDEPMAFTAHPRDPVITQEPLARAWAERAEAEVHAELQRATIPPAAPVSDSVSAGEYGAGGGAGGGGGDGPGIFDADDPLFDEEALRDIVREIIREELAGTLGERITRNVRKLVRVEINRALTAREFE